MAQFGPSDQTIQISSGNVRTTLDKFDATQLNNNAQNTLGSAYWDSTVSAAFPNGLAVKYRYVRYNSAANPAVQAAPAAVYWTDQTMTTVTGKLSEAWGSSSAFAGLLMPNSTDFVGLTAAILNGNFVWIATAGIVLGVVSAAAAAGDQLLATQADWTTTGGFSKVAVGVAPTNRVAGYAFAASPSTVFVAAESI